MPVYRIQAPSGQILRVEGPEGASEEVLAEVAEQYMAQAAQPAKPTEQAPGFIEQAGAQIAGAGESALTLATGATTGTAGYIGGVLQGIASEMLSGEFGSQEAAKRIAESAQTGMGTLTYAPRTEAGQQQVEAIGKVGEQLAPFAGLPQTGAIAQAARGVAPIASAPAAKVISKAVDPARAGIEKIKQRLAAPPTSQQIPGQGMSGGAAAVEQATVRRGLAQDLPVPMTLTKGQETRDPMDLKFEQETAKLEEGAPFREKFAEQNIKLQQNLDSFIDSTGAEIHDWYAVGEKVNSVLKQRAAKDKKKIRTLYKEAEKAGEMEEAVDLTPLREFLSENESAESLAPILTGVGKELNRLESKKGININDSEKLRKFINKVSGADPTNIKFASEMKQIIDTATEDKGGKLYRQARKSRRKYAEDYENAALTRSLIGKKRGTDDRAVALENFVNKIAISPSTSREQMIQLRRMLQTGAGAEGKQAWKEVQGGVLRHIRDEALKNVAPDQFGNRVLSPSQLDRVLTNLDKSGKLDYIFGPQGAEKLRVINDVAKDVLTVPQGTVNTSNTATTLAFLMDIAVSGTSGIPAPLATGYRTLVNNIKDAKLRKRIQEHLGEVE